MTARDMWNAFIALHPEAACAGYEAWAYGDDPDTLARLTLARRKLATASLHMLYAMDGEPLPQAGEYSVILDSQGEAVCVIRTSCVSIRPFQEVDERHAFLEGEGDRSLAYWRAVHERFFRMELIEYDIGFTQDIAVVCEEFEVMYP